MNTIEIVKAYTSSSRSSTYISGWNPKGGDYCHTCNILPLLGYSIIEKKMTFTIDPVQPLFVSSTILYLSHLYHIVQEHIE